MLLVSLNPLQVLLKDLIAIAVAGLNIIKHEV